MNHLFLVVAVCMSLAFGDFGYALAADKIGLSLPLTGRFKTVATRMEFGAMLAVEHLNKSGGNLELVVVDDKCDPATASDIANELNAKKAKIVVGPVCFRFAAALADAFKPVDDTSPPVPVVAFNTRNKLLNRLREVDELPLYSVSNGNNAEAQAVVDFILPRFDGKPFAILDDGSVYGRALADEIRLLGEQVGFKAVVNTNFRPLQNTQLSLLRRLKNSGIEAVFIAAAAEDVATIANDMQSLGLDWKMATGERGVLLPYTTNPNTPLDNLMMVKEAEIAIKRTDSELHRQQTDASVLAGYALVELAAQIISKQTQNLSGQTFDTSIGPLRFNGEGRASAAPFTLFEWNDGGFDPVVGN